MGFKGAEGDGGTWSSREGNTYETINGHSCHVQLLVGTGSCSQEAITGSVVL